MRITQQQVADKLGLSQQAIAFAVSDSPEAHKQLRPETRRRILETARQMGYVPNNAARRLARARSNSRGAGFDQIGLIYLNPIGSSLDLGFLTMMAGAEHELSTFHASLTFVRVGESADWNKVERLARADGVDGWLVVGQVDDALADQLDALGQPFVIVGDSCCTRPVPHVDVDNFAVGCLAAHHLASLGHRRIAYVCSHLGYAYQRLTYEGFRAGVKELGLEQDDRWLAQASTWERDDGVAILEWLDKLDPVPTALFVPELTGTTELCRAMPRSPRKVPLELSLLGIDLTPPTQVNPGITRVQLPIREIGRQSILLLHRLVSGAAVENIEIKIAPTLAEEGTTAAPYTLG